MSIVDQMNNVFESIKGKDTLTGAEFFQNYPEDFTIYDTDVIESHYDSGDVLIWEIRGDGCGTHLFNAKNPLDHHRFGVDAQKASRFFRIDVESKNDGDLFQLKNYDRAFKVMDELKGSPCKSLRRSNLFGKLGDAIGMDSSNFPYNFKNDLNLTTGEDIFLQVEYDQLHKVANVHMVKPTLKKDEPGVSRTKPQESFSKVRPDEVVFMGSMETRRFKVTPGRDSLFGEVQKVTKREFDAAVRKAQRNQAKHELR